jgi:CheY-like chemotaxis protein
MLKVLMVDDNTEDVMLAERALRRAGLEVAFSHVHSRSGLEDAVKQGHHVVLCDSRGLGFDAHAALKSHGMDFISFSGLDAEESREGSLAFVHKDRMRTDLAPAVVAAALERGIDLGPGKGTALMSAGLPVTLATLSGMAVGTVAPFADMLHRVESGVVTGVIVFVIAKAISRLLRA